MQLHHVGLVNLRGLEYFTARLATELFHVMAYFVDISLMREYFGQPLALMAAHRAAVQLLL